MPKKLTQLAAATAVTDADQVGIEQAGTSKRATLGILATALPTNYIGGLITSNNGSDALHDIDIAPGVARDNTDVDNMRLAAVLTKQIDAAWAVGTDQGGFDTGVVAGNTMYAIWLIKRSDTGIVDALFSLSFTAPTMPTNYDRKRLIGAIQTTGAADIKEYLQSGDDFRYIEVFFTDVNDSTLTTLIFETGTLSAPPKSRAHIALNLANLTTTDTSGRATVRTPADVTSWTAAQSWLFQQWSTGAFRNATVVGDILVDENSQIEYAAIFTDGAPTLKIATFGFRMMTRQEP